jgi:hypothetical protein
MSAINELGVQTRSSRSASVGDDMDRARAQNGALYRTSVVKPIITGEKNEFLALQGLKYIQCQDNDLFRRSFSCNME